MKVRSNERLFDWHIALLGLSLLVILAALIFGCAPVQTPATDPTAEPTCRAIWHEELGRAIDPPALVDCLARARGGAYEPELRQPVHDSPEAVAYRKSLETPPPAPLPNAGETLPLHMDGTTIRDSAGAVKRLGGITAFRLYKRFVDGEDIEPILTDYITCGGQCTAGEGPNSVRVLLSASVLFDLPTSATTPAILDAFFDKLAARGLYGQAEVLIDANPDHGAYPNARPTAATQAEQQAFLDLVAPVLARHWNAIGSLCNECSHRISRVDRGAFQRPAGDILWSRGSGQADEAPFSPPWSLVTDHSGRQDDWPRRLPCRDVRSQDGAPWGIHAACYEDEPMGAADVDQPGRRSAIPDDFTQFAANAGLNSNGALFHADAGIQTTKLTRPQAQLAAAFFAGLHFAPPEALLWPYRRGGLSGALASCIAHSDNDGALRTFSKESPAGVCFSVAIRPTSHWSAVALEGRHVVDMPRHGLVRTEK